MPSVTRGTNLDDLLSSLNRFRLTIVVLVLVGTLTVLTMGFPQLLMLAGACTFAFVTNQRFSCLAGPASWAAGIVIEAFVLGTESAALAMLVPHSHQQYVYVLMLAAPLIIGLALLGLLLSTERPLSQRDSGRMSGEPFMAITVIVLIETMFEIIKLHGQDFGLSWSMWGDSRNHVVLTRSILSAGGITLTELKAYPAMINALSAILDGASGRANLSAGVLMTRDVQAQAAVFILSSMALALLFIAAVVETIPRGVNYVRRLPIFVTIPLIASGSLGIGSFVLGLALSGGYLSAIGSLVFAMVSIVLGMRIIRRYSDVTLILLTLSLLLTVSSWTVLFVVPATSLIIGYLHGAHHIMRAKRRGLSTRVMAMSMITLGASMLCLTAVVVTLIVNRVRLESHFKTNAAIPAPNPHFYIWLGIGALVVVALAPNREQRTIRLLPLLVFVTAGAAVWWVRGSEPLGNSWSYDLTKILWLATCCILWVPFVLLADLIRKVNDWYSKSGVRGITSVLVSVTGSAMVLVGMAHETPFPFPFEWAFTGSSFPSPKEVALVIHEANIGGPFVIWDYFKPYDDQYGDFWSALTWDYTADGGPIPWPGSNFAFWAYEENATFANWAYEENGTFAALCTAVTKDRLRVVTRSRTLLPELKSSCLGYVGNLSAESSSTSP